MNDSFVPQPAPVPAPPVVAWLGYGGLIPFVALAIARWLELQAPLTSQALMAYGAVILGFVGALHWGFAMTLGGLAESARTRLFVWSIVPSLIAWPALLLAPRTGALLLAAGFIAHYLQDRRLASRVALPSWYLPLRLRLSAVACVCLGSLWL